MNRVILMAMVFLAIAATAQAKNYFYGDQELSMVSDGYKLFVSDNIMNTVDKMERGADERTAYCAGADENTVKHIGDISVVRSDNRLRINGNAKISYFAACNTYYSVVDRLKTADDIRRLWLLFADSATDDYTAETINKHSANDDPGALIEMRRLEAVSKYIEFFTKNKEWKLTDYTFLSQAFKARKDKTLSPVFAQFISALLTGDAENAFQVVRSIDLDDLGSRFIPPVTGDDRKLKGADRHK
ncbi:MAG: hypothetical protein WA946_14445 [Nitrospirota bacterium]